MIHRARRVCCPFVTVIAMLSLCAGCGGVVVEADYPVEDYDGYPPDGYIATTEPVYFEGHPTYYYRGAWFYRDGGHWHHYDHEPQYLEQWRRRAQPERRYYEPRRVGPPRQSHGSFREGRRRGR